MARRCRYGALLVLLLGLGTLARWGAGPRGGGLGAASPTVGAEELEAPGATDSGAVARAAPDLFVPPGETTHPSPEQALVAAVAARNAGDRVGEEAMLVAALAGSDLAQVARVELAELVLASEPRRAASELLPVVVSPLSRELQWGAVDLLVQALIADSEAVGEADLRRVVAVLPRPAARRVELATAGPDPSLRRQRLGRLLRESVDDPVALAAAEGLASLGELDRMERWHSGRAFFQHGHYVEALQVLSGLEGSAGGGGSEWELPFTSGRACFRLGRWEEASARYQEAVAKADTRERAAMLEVHRSRALELGGRLEDAVDGARRAVESRATDERRLHLLRLRLRQGRLDLAAEGQRRLRGLDARDEGALRMALHDLAAGRTGIALRRLEGIRTRPWGAAAAVIRAGHVAAEGEWAEALAILDGSVDLLDPYWGGAARQVMVSLPEAEREEWRRRCRQGLVAGAGSERRRSLQRWALLECEPEALAELRREVAGMATLEHREQGQPAFTSPLATRLWSLGLEAEVGRFDPGAFPRGTVGEALWSARTLVAFGRARQAIRLAESATRQAFPRVPTRVLPVELREVLYPLPWPYAVVEAAVASGVEASLLAGLVREESRWEATARSAVGARGLTQLMPATAAATAARLGWAAPAADSLLEPRLALRLGAAELARLLAVFGGHRAATVAAYNAGEPQARIWLEECGSGCTDDRLVASVTFDATRGYVAEVLASAEEYRELYPGLGTPTEEASGSVEASGDEVHHD